jgi:hypothetical protein
LNAEILEAQAGFVLHIVESHIRDKYGARFRNPFKTGGDIDAVAIEVAALHHDIPEINAYAKHDLTITGKTGVGGGHRLLQLEGAPHGVDRTAKFDEHAITSYLENPPLVVGYEWFEHSLASRLEYGKRARLILTHEPAVTDHIRGQYGSKTAFDTSFRHGRRLLQGTQTHGIIWAPGRMVY